MESQNESSLGKGLGRLAEVSIFVVGFWIVAQFIPESASSEAAYNAAMLQANSIIVPIVVTFDNFVGDFLLIYFTLFGLAVGLLVVYAVLTHRKVVFD
jgi:hypothetical protein